MWTIITLKETLWTITQSLKLKTKAKLPYYNILAKDLSS